MSTITGVKKAFHHYGIFKILSYLRIDEFPRENYFKQRSYYENILQQYIKLENYINIFSNKIALSSLHTDINILPNLLGKSVKNIIRTKGNPDFVFKEKDISIFVYKRKFNSINDRCKIHFYKNKVFFVNHNYPSINEKDKIYVLKAVKQKYLNAFNSYVDIPNCKIIDNNNNMIFIEDFMGLKISYFCNSESQWFIEMSLKIKTNNELKNAKISLREKHFVSNI